MVLYLLFCHTVEEIIGIPVDILDYRGHSMEYGTKSKSYFLH